MLSFIKNKIQDPRVKLGLAIGGGSLLGYLAGNNFGSSNSRANMLNQQLQQKNIDYNNLKRENNNLKTELNNYRSNEEFENN